jgi:uncharacterized protein (TIGR03382 family)
MEGCGCQGAPAGGLAALSLAAALLARRRYSQTET